ncbi:MAG: FtsX-like permease family protein [Myxococcota bacterium]
MAWRNVWRNSRRTGAAIAATSLGLLAMIFYSGLAAGYIGGMEKNILNLEMGDVQVFHPEFRETQSIHDRIDAPAEILAQLDAEGLPASARLLGSGLAAAGDSSSGVSLRGIDVARDATVSEINTHIDKGEWLDEAKPSEVVIGRRLARMLGVDLGDEIVVLSQGADGSSANDLYTVRGVLKSVGDAVDRGGIFMVDAAFRELMVVPEGVHQIIVRRGDSTLEAASASVVGATGELEAKTWRELNPTLASMLDSSRGAMTMMFVIVYMAIGIVILNSMLMTVFERIREFGVLKALGVGPGGVMKLILLETMFQTAVAIIIGVTLSIPVNMYMVNTGFDMRALMGDTTVMGVAMDPIWRSVVTVDTYVQPIVTLVVIIAFAVIYPALRAAFIRPIEAMHSQ